MDDEEITSDDIRHAAMQSASEGVQSFSDGTTSVTAMDPQKQLDVADRIDRATAATNSTFGLRFTAMNGGGAWQ